MSWLQIAADAGTPKQVINIADEIHDVIDVFEVGTPLIVRDGLLSVRLVKEKYPNMVVLADTKISDGGNIICEDACKAGADIITVLAISDDTTIKAVVDIAHKYNRKAMADLLHVCNIADRAKALIDLNVDFVCVHTAFDLRSQGKTPLDELRLLAEIVPSNRIAVAGGISISTLDQYLAENPAIVVMGGALCGALNIRQAVIETKKYISDYHGK